MSNKGCLKQYEANMKKGVGKRTAMAEALGQKGVKTDQVTEKKNK